MNTVYPNESRYVLEAFCIENGSVEFLTWEKSRLSEKVLCSEVQR